MTMTTFLALSVFAVSSPGRHLLLALLRGPAPAATLLLLAIGASAAAEAEAATPSPLVGTWTEIDGPGAARIAPCATAPERLCAIGLERRAGSTDRVEGGIVLSDIAVSGTNAWRGRYHDGRRRYAASLRLLGPATVEMKVCVLFICQSARYGRSG